MVVTPGVTSPQNGTFNTQIQGFAPVYLVDVYDEVLTVGTDNRGRPINETVKQMVFIFLPPDTISNDTGVNPAPPGTTPSGKYVISLLG